MKKDEALKPTSISAFFEKRKKNEDKDCSCRGMLMICKKQF